MIQKALEYLVGLGAAETHEIEGQIYSDKPLHLVIEPKPAHLVVRNLSGLVDYLKSNYDDLPPVLVHVESPTEVSVYGSFSRDWSRNHYIMASALLPSIPFGRFLDMESFNILLQSCFVPNEDRSNVLRIVGNVKEENVTSVGDDGISQQVTAKTGIATVENVIVPNPVLLKPYRTFVEVAQPESEFVFRMRSGPEAALFEADGGSWKLEAIQRIKDYLAEELAEQIRDKFVTIIG